MFTYCGLGSICGIDSFCSDKEKEDLRKELDVLKQIIQQNEQKTEKLLNDILNKKTENNLDVLEQLIKMNQDENKEQFTILKKNQNKILEELGNVLLDIKTIRTSTVSCGNSTNGEGGELEVDIPINDIEINRDINLEDLSDDETNPYE